MGTKKKTAAPKKAAKPLIEGRYEDLIKVRFLPGEGDYVIEIMRMQNEKTKSGAIMHAIKHHKSLVERNQELVKDLNKSNNILGMYSRRVAEYLEAGNALVKLNNGIKEDSYEEDTDDYPDDMDPDDYPEDTNIRDL